MDAVDTSAVVGANGENNESDAGVNAKLKERLARKDWYKDTQSPYYEVRVSLRNARIKTHYVRYFDATQLNIHLIENAPALLQTRDITLKHLETIIGDLEAKLDKAAKEFESEIAAGETLAQSEGVRLELKFFQDPLELDVRIISPLCYRYLDVIQKADRFLVVAHCLQLRAKITFLAFNQKCQRVYEVLTGIQRATFEFQFGLRAQARKVKAGTAPKLAQENLEPETQGAPPRSAKAAAAPRSKSKKASKTHAAAEVLAAAG